MKKMLIKRGGGFTLIELIIVIAILGILAVVVLSAINPVEQIRKANDARRRSNGAELLNALERYYATYGAYPTGFPGVAAVPGTKVTSANVALLGSEMKAEFQARVAKPGNELFASEDTNTALVHVCFQIESEEQLNKYGASGSGTYAMPGGGATDKVVCLPE